MYYLYKGWVRIYNIEFLDNVMSACFSLRKIKTILLHEDKGIYRLRPQIHPMIISPFGTAKSSITKGLYDNFKDSIYAIDDFTKASITGSMTKLGDYIPTFLENVGGKVLIIDEWNLVDTYGQNALIGVLENQTLRRTLGFKVTKPYKYKGKLKEYIDYSITKNVIEGKFCFSCLCYAMEYPIYENGQKAKALLSRFSPLFIEPTKQMIESLTKGEFAVNINDKSYDVDVVEIPNKIYNEFHGKYHEYINKNNLYPLDSDDYGYISRTMSEIIRYGIYDYLCKNSNPDKKIVIDEMKYFENNFDYINTLMLQFENPKTKGKVYQYKKLLQKYGKEKSKVWYAKMLGVNRHMIYEYDSKLGTGD